MMLCGLSMRAMDARELDVFCDVAACAMRAACDRTCINLAIMFLGKIGFGGLFNSPDTTMLGFVCSSSDCNCINISTREERRNDERTCKEKKQKKNNLPRQFASWMPRWPQSRQFSKVC